MANRVRTLLLTDEQRAVLLRQARAKGSPARVVERARIVLLAADGVPGVEIARAGRLLGADGDPLAVPVRRACGVPEVGAGR